MLPTSLGALLLTLGFAHGFNNASPFFALSTRPMDQMKSAVVATGEDVSNNVNEQFQLDMLSAEMAERAVPKYFVYSQPGLTSDDLEDSQVLPKMKAMTTGNGYQGRVEIANVIGELDVKSLAKELGAGQGSIVRGQALPKEKAARAKALKKLDEQIAANVPETSIDYAFILMSSPVAEESFDPTPEHQYEMDEPFPTAMHQDLKRHVDVLPRQSGNSSTHMQDGLPLFERYQFLTPGLFMGLTVSLLLLVILWVGVSAISGLEVSYKAFTKEMGPQAQNKGKQQQ